MAPRKKTHCKYGHEFTPENILFCKDKKGYTLRKCRTCRNQYDRERYRDKPHRAEALKRRAYERYHGITEVHP